MEKSDLKNLGTLTVPSVQSLVQEMKLSQVPARYIHPVQDRPDLTTSVSSSQVPVIDLQRLQSGEFKESELHKLDSACQEWGFFQLINHGVSQFLVDKVKFEVKAFFNLPEEEKKKFSIRAGEAEGYGQNFVLSEDQKLDWADLLFIVMLPTYSRKPHLFPNLPESFRNSLEAYSSELKILATKIIDLMVEALKMDPEDFKGLFDDDARQAMRMNYYPPCPQPELVIGLTPHSDLGILTFLLEINEIEGLQIRKDGSWIPVKAVPDAFIVNIGDTLEILTNGKYRSIEHRAIVNSVKERLSLATFLSTKMEQVIGPAPSLVTPETPAVFGTTTFQDYLRGFLSRKLEGKSYLDVVRLANN